MSITVDDTLTLQEAADQLGVHYMTAYRYVRLGQLAAHKQGGTWQIKARDLARFRADAAAAATPSPGGSAAPRRVADWTGRYEARLLAGDATGAWRVLEAALASGAELDLLYLDVIAPAMRSIGERWERGEIDVAEEHRASAVTLRIMGRLAPRFVRRGRPRMSVVIGAAPGDPHSLPVSLLADLLTGAGFDVVDLGANVPVESFLFAAANAGRLGAVGVSVSADLGRDRAREVVAAIHDQFPGVPVLVGGPAVGDAVTAQDLGADHWAADARAAVAVLNDLAR